MKTNNKNKFPAEMWDKMQFILRNYYDGTMHTALYYDGELDIDILKNAYMYIIKTAKILRSTFHKSAIRSYWTINEDYSPEDFFYFIETDKPEEELDKFITQKIDEKSKIQFKIALIRSNGKDIIGYIVNHMCFDGGDLRYFYLTTAKLYNEYIQTGSFQTKIKDGSRSSMQVYDIFNEEDRKKALKLNSNVSSVKNVASFPYTDATKEDRNRIVKEYIPKEEFLAFKAKGKENNASINDLFLTAYIRTIYEMCNMKESDPLNISCMCDLRRYMKDGQTYGMTNLTGFMPSSVQNIGNSFNETLAVVCKDTQVQKEDKFLGLYSIPLLNLAFNTFIDSLASFCIKLGYKNPIFSMSNIGIIKPEQLIMGDKTLVDGWSTGAVKYKPYVQLAMTTFDNSVTMTIASRMNEKDAETAKKFLELVHKNIKDYIK